MDTDAEELRAGGDPQRPLRLSNLGAVWHDQYVQSGDVDDRDRAITCFLAAREESGPTLATVKTTRPWADYWQRDRLQARAGGIPEAVLTKECVSRPTDSGYAVM